MIPRLAVMLFSSVKLYTELNSSVSTLNSVKGQKTKVGLSFYSWAKTWKLKKQKKKKEKKKKKKETKQRKNKHSRFSLEFTEMFFH